MRAILLIRPWILGSITALPWIAMIFLFDDVVYHPWIMGLAMLPWLIFLIWLFFTVNILTPLAPSSGNIPTRMIRFNLFVVTAYFLLVSFAIMTSMDGLLFRSSWGVALVLVHIYCVYGMFYLTYNASKIVLLAEGGRDVRIGDTILLVVQMAFFPFTAYVLQKRLIKVARR